MGYVTFELAKKRKLLPKRSPCGLVKIIKSGRKSTNDFAFATIAECRFIQSCFDVGFTAGIPLKSLVFGSRVIAPCGKTNPPTIGILIFFETQKNINTAEAMELINNRRV